MRFEIPAERLPPGFLESLDAAPPTPVPPRPAATVVLARDAVEGPEVLLMRRHRASGFVPGAWVFPGGRVDAADSRVARSNRLQGVPDGPAPAQEFWVAALRELFEETGVLLARTHDGAWAADASSDPELEAYRHALLRGDAALLDLLHDRDLTLDAGAATHLAHWVTPVVETRRYDTHFFVAALPPGHAPAHDPREMTDARWITPARALERFEQGELPMVFPTVKTLGSLAGFASVLRMVDALRGRDVPTVLPRLVRTARGVAMVVDP